MLCLFRAGSLIIMLKTDGTLVIVYTCASKKYSIHKIWVNPSSIPINSALVELLALTFWFHEKLVIAPFPNDQVMCVSWWYFRTCLSFPQSSLSGDLACVVRNAIALLMSLHALCWGKEAGLPYDERSQPAPQVTALHLSNLWCEINGHLPTIKQHLGLF